MPKITVRVPHSLEPAAAFAKIQPALEKTVSDFQGHDLAITGNDTSSTFTLKSMAFTIKGKAEAAAGEICVEIELPFAAMMFKALSSKGINILAITTSEIKISVLIDAAYAELAVRTLHSIYGLDAD